MSSAKISNTFGRAGSAKAPVIADKTISRLNSQPSEPNELRFLFTTKRIVLKYAPTSPPDIAYTITAVKMAHDKPPQPLLHPRQRGLIESEASPFGHPRQN